MEAVIVLAIDDMREPARFEEYLRPIFDRLKRIDGRAPVSIMSNTLDPHDPQEYFCAVGSKGTLRGAANVARIDELEYSNAKGTVKLPLKGE